LKRWVRNTLWSGLGVVVLVGAGAAWGTWYFNPQRHFAQTKHPVLIEPSASANQPSTSPNSTGQTASSSPQQPTQQEKQQSDSFNVLILGIDSEDDANSRTDVIMVAHVNPHDKTINLVSVPRDTRVNLPGIGYTKINHAHFVGNLQNGNHAGTQASLHAVSDLLNVPINYYVKTNFMGFEHFVDTIGGVDVVFPYRVGSLSAGLHHMNGAVALEAVRERYSLPGGDLDRESDQALVLKAIMQKMLSPENLPKLPDLYKQVKTDLVDTNFTDSDLLSLALLFKGFSNSQMHYVQVPGQGGEDFDPLVKMKLYYWFPDLAGTRAISDQYLHDPSDKKQ
jgi:polyisoprenyl-teichoic acid--peptidoglycan teichoic acid transferase